MSPPPPSPSLFHITHVANLPAIVAAGGLRSDAAMIDSGAAVSAVGMGKLKRARLSLPVHPHPGTKVGDDVPFYFCPRSLVLYILHKGNHQDVSCRGGQAPIVHLEADLHAVVAAMNQAGRRWAFTLSNAAAVYTEFRSDVRQLGDIDWTAVASNDFRDERVKHGKQAEFQLAQAPEGARDEPDTR